MLETFKDIGNSEKILIAGAGGGFDIYHGIPLYFKLRALGKEVILANLSFSALRISKSKQLTKHSWEINDESIDLGYFPEKHLYDWLKRLGITQRIIGFEKTGVLPLYESYEKLIKRESIDTLILIDGGTDILMKGDETSLGTPSEDACSLCAVSRLELLSKYLVCIGFGIDTFHGICHSDFLENISSLIKSGGYLGCFSLNPQDEYLQYYIGLINYSNQKMPYSPSIVGNSIKDSLLGEFGDYHSTSRTGSSELYINPLMSINWVFDLDRVAKQNLYLDMLKETKTITDVKGEIEKYRSGIKRKKWRSIPH